MANPSPQKPMPGALIDAVWFNDIKAVTRLLAAGANVDEKDGNGNSALSRAASGGRPEIVRLLLDKGAKLDSRNNLGNTALICVTASYLADKEMIARLLLDKGADMDIRNDKGETALMIAVQKSEHRIVSLLKETYLTRKSLADQFARAEVAVKQQRLKVIAMKRPKPGPGPKPPEAA